MAQISSIATQSPLSLSPIQPLSAAIEIMAKRGFRRAITALNRSDIGFVPGSAVDSYSFENAKKTEAQAIPSKRTWWALKTKTEVSFV